MKFVFYFVLKKNVTYLLSRSRADRECDAKQGNTNTLSDQSLITNTWRQVLVETPEHVRQFPESSRAVTTEADTITSTHNLGKILSTMKLMKGKILDQP